MHAISYDFKIVTIMEFGELFSDSFTQNPRLRKHNVIGAKRFIELLDANDSIPDL